MNAVIWGYVWAAQEHLMDAYVEGHAWAALEDSIDAQVWGYIRVVVWAQMKIKTANLHQICVAL